MSRMLLSINGLKASYGAGNVLHGIDLSIVEGEIVALLGANGAGKTTTLRAISGLMKRAEGSIRLESSELIGMRPERIARAGIAHVPEGRRVFPGLTVRENILLGASSRGRIPARKLNQEVDEMLDFFIDLKRLEHTLAWKLSGGQLQMVAVARGLMARPKLLVLDEPSLGLAPIIVQAVFQIVSNIRGTGTTVLLVEQNAHMALSVADRAYVLETGLIVIEGTREELWDNPRMRSAYLGGGALVTS